MPNIKKYYYSALTKLTLPKPVTWIEEGIWGNNTITNYAIELTIHILQAERIYPYFSAPNIFHNSVSPKTKTSRSEG